MTWVLYQQTVDALEGPAKRKFLHGAEDWQGLREFDLSKQKETNIGTGGAP